MVDCNHCYKHDNQLISEECIFCQKHLFQEDILCDLLRTEQYKGKGLECFAFKPNLKIIYKKDEVLKKTTILRVVKKRQKRVIGKSGLKLTCFNN